MIIRRIRITDIAHLKKLENELAAFDRKKDPFLKKNAGKYYFKDLKNKFKEKSTFGFVAIENNEIVGMITGLVENTFADAYLHRKEGLVRGFVVKKEYRKKGVGKKLLESVMKEFKKRGIKVYIVYFYSKNPAKKLYKKMGFKEYLSIARYSK